MDKPKVVVLCGSSRFVDIMAVCAWLIERDEKAITMGLHLMPFWYMEQLENIYDHLAESEGCASEMDELHLRKIDLCDEIFVVNFRNYVGASTTKEIKYAEAAGKKIRWLTHDPIGNAAIEKLTAWLRENEPSHLPICRQCGCEQDSACPGGCFWIEEDLCSSCKPEASP